MPTSESSPSESEENVSSEDGGPNKQQDLSNYELQRLKRIEDNKKRMEALGLQKIANSLMGSVEKTQKKNYEKKGKRKIADEDDEYNPSQDNEETSSSAEEDENEEQFSISQKKVKRNSSTPKKQGPNRRPIPDSDYVEDDDALMQAIALSLQDSVSSPPQSSGAHIRNTTSSITSAKDTIDAASDKRKGKPSIRNDSGQKKRKKPFSSRVQMTEDEMIVQFFHFDETGKGGINIRDVQRLAIAHDFTWSEKEMAHMISCFDSDGDGKINLDDFRKIVCRCNMLKGSD